MPYEDDDQYNKDLDPEDILEGVEREHDSEDDEDPEHDEEFDDEEFDEFDDEDEDIFLDEELDDED